MLKYGKLLEQHVILQTQIRYLQKQFRELWRVTNEQHLMIEELKQQVTRLEQERKL